MFEHLRKERLEPLSQCGIGTISNAHPHNGRFAVGGKQEHVLKVFVFRDDHMLLVDRVRPYGRVMRDEQLDRFDVDRMMTEGCNNVGKCGGKLRVD